MKVENPRVDLDGMVRCEDCLFDIVLSFSCAAKELPPFSDGNECPTLATYQEACALADAAAKEGGRMKLHWTDGGDGITNFNDSDRSLYENAIAVSGMAGLYISDEGLYPGKGPSLCDSVGHRDLSDFWHVFWQMRKGDHSDPEEVLP